jgi:hypothetical protein
MTFSSASVSACEVDDVAATAAGAIGLRGGGGEAGRWRATGAKAGTEPVAGAPRAITMFDEAAFAAGAVLRTTVRAIGRGFGNGTFGLAHASAAIADNPTASARVVARAVDRNAAARAEGVTAFLCGGESLNRSSRTSI